MPRRERGGREVELVERVTTRPVTRENFAAALRLGVRPEQQRFVADYAPIAALGLAKAYVRPGGLVWEPYAFYAGDAMVGFGMLAYEPGSAEEYLIFHFFIDGGFQGRGYGREALALLIREVREGHPAARAMKLTVHPENEAARRLYMGAGFRPTGEMLFGEPLYRLALRGE